MGEAKRRREHAAQMDQQVAGAADVFAGVSGALQRMAEAASANIGRDCLVHALLAAELLADAGIPATVVVGYAAWRVGEGDGDVLSHVPNPSIAAQPGAEAYHAWLEIGDWIFDPTTYQLDAKARALDALDNGQTQVDWAPPYLLVRKATVSSFEAVAQGGQGLYHYIANCAVRQRVMDAAVLDPDDLATARFLYRHPAVDVVGPNCGMG